MRSASQPTVKLVHPSYFEMTVVAISSKRDWKGHPEKVTQKCTNYKLSPAQIVVYLLSNLQNGLAQKEFGPTTEANHETRSQYIELVQK